MGSVGPCSPAACKALLVCGASDPQCGTAALKPARSVPHVRNLHFCQHCILSGNRVIFHRKNLKNVDPCLFEHVVLVNTRVLQSQMRNNSIANGKNHWEADVGLWHCATEVHCECIPTPQLTATACSNPPCCWRHTFCTSIGEQQVTA